MNARFDSDTDLELYRQWFGGRMLAQEVRIMAIRHLADALDMRLRPGQYYWRTDCAGYLTKAAEWRLKLAQVKGLWCGICGLMGHGDSDCRSVYFPESDTYKTDLY